MNGLLPMGYEFVPWTDDLLSAHAEAKYRSFQREVDSHVFPCLGDLHGCLRLMEEISQKPGFLPEATWLVRYVCPDELPDYCGTIQGLRDDSGHGGIQNIGITPEHRGKGIGTALIRQTLLGFQAAGLSRAYLEVTVRNSGALRLYRRLGFRRIRTVYKAVEAVYS
jgi:GNAT superfamily N-acetyltransferase